MGKGSAWGQEVGYWWCKVLAMVVLGRDLFESAWRDLFDDVFERTDWVRLTVGSYGR